MKPLICSLAIVTLSACALYTDGDAIEDRIDATPTVADAAPVIPSIDADVTDCATELPCPNPPNTGLTANVCGRLVNAATLRPLAATAPTSDLCADDDDGPCALRLQAFDPLAFYADPAGTAPLSIETLQVDRCGRFRALGVRRPFNGFVGITVDGPGYRTAFLSSRVDNGRAVAGARVHAVTEALDTAWTTSAGMPFGDDTFATRGAVLFLFRHAGDGVSGVMATSGGTTHPDVDYYFAINGERLDTVDPALHATTANGAALVTDISLGQTSGQGSEPPGCVWSSELAAAAPGVIAVVARPAELATTGGPCP